MDREELEERIRGRRPGDPGFRRGVPVDDVSGPEGYVPFQPEPEDALAAREAETPEGARHRDNTPLDFDAQRAAAAPPFVPPAEPPPDAYRPHEAQEPPPAPAYVPPSYDAPAYEAPVYEADAVEPSYEPEEPYPYTYPERGGGDGRRGGGALPVIGFVALCALALAVGAVLAGVLGGPGDVAQTTPTPSATLSNSPSEPPASASSTESGAASTSATPEPTDGPITFADGASITVQPCATRGMSFDGCDEDGSVVSGDVWIWIGFEDALGSDTFTIGLRSANETIDQQETVLGDILDCPNRCSGYLIGAVYHDLDPGDYVIVVRRNGDFADSARFRVEG
jgi:hypothetical protein